MQPHITGISEKDTTQFPQESEGDETYPEAPSISHSSAEQDSLEKQHPVTAEGRTKQCSLATGPFRQQQNPPHKQRYRRPTDKNPCSYAR
jgi:hypothetical protein